MSRFWRIVFVLSESSGGGFEKQLAKWGVFRPEPAVAIDVHGITLLPTMPRAVERQLVDHGARGTLFDRSSMAYIPSFVRLLCEIQRLRPAIVRTLLDSSTGAWGRLAAWLAWVSVSVQSDSLLPTAGTRTHYSLRPWLDRVTTRFLPSAHAIAERLVDNGVPREKIRVMPNSVDLGVFDPLRVATRQQEWGIDDTATALGSLVRFAVQERIDVLLDALLSWPESARPVHVRLAGDGPTMAEARSSIGTDAWLQNPCRLLGAIDDTPAFLASLDYLVLPSDSESLPNVVLKAMAMGKPIIATGVSDLARLEGDAGFLVPSGDVGVLANTLGGMQGLAPAERRTLGAVAREGVERESDIVVGTERTWKAHFASLSCDVASEAAVHRGQR